MHLTILGEAPENALVSRFALFFDALNQIFAMASP